MTTRICPMLLMAALLSVGCSRDEVAPSPLPALPDATSHGAAVIQLLGERDSAAREDPTSAQAVGALANAYHANGLYERAQQCYKLAQNLDPKDWRWIYYQVLIALEQGDGEAARRRLEETVALQGDYAPAWYRLAQMRAKSGDAEAAAEAYRRAQQADGRAVASRARRDTPVAAYADLGLARLAIKRGDQAEARTLLEQSVKRHPRFGPAHRLLGTLAGELGDDHARFAHLGRASLLGPFTSPPDPLEDTLLASCRDADLLLRRASIARRNNLVQLHSLLVLAALDLKPDDRRVMLEAATAHRTNGRMDKAIQLLQRRLKGAGDQANTWMELAGCYEQMNRYDEAEKCMRKALALGETNTKNRQMLAMNLLAQHKYAQAIELSRQLLAEDPNLESTHTVLGACAYFQNHHEAAVGHVRRALALNPYAMQARHVLARSLRQLGRYDQCHEVMRQTLSFNPNDEETVMAMAWLLATCPDEKFRNGAEAVKLAQRKPPAHVHDLVVLAACHAEAGEFDRAVSVVKQAQAMLQQRGGTAQAIQILDEYLAAYRKRQPWRRPAMTSRGPGR